METQREFTSVHVESSLPRAWQNESTFNDVLYDWMSRAPWLGISTAAHVVLFLVLLAIPWGLLHVEEHVVIVTHVAPPTEELFEPPPEEVQPEIEERLPEEPQLVDRDISDTDDPVDEPQDTTLGDEGLTDSLLEHLSANDVIGMGPGAGDKFGSRFGPGGAKRKPGGSGTEQALLDGLEWLKHHQSPDGSWDCDGFSANCGKLGATVCGGGGEASHDVGMTGLALLAFLGDGNTTRAGPYRDVVARGIAWLQTQQDPDLGLLGERSGHSFLYDHAIATLALCEAYYFSKSPLIKRAAQDAVHFITRARNPYSAWRYDYPPTGANDTSVTGWMVFALKSAEDGGLNIDEQAYLGALSWFDEVTEPATGRTGYDATGTLSSRVTGLNDRYPPEAGESMTAVALLCRFFMGQVPAQTPIMEKHADLLRAKLPEWDPAGLRNDMYYWYYGSYAMFQMGGVKYWEPWNKALKKAVLDSQRHDGDEKGSWDPKDAWGFAGGRVYSTALMVLCLEVYFRYARVLGAR